MEPDIAHKYDGWHDACAFNVAKVMDITLNNGRAFGDQIGPKTGEITEFTCIEDFINAFEKQMEFFVRNMVEADNCIDTAHGDLVPLPFESGLIEGCIEKRVSRYRKAAQSGTSPTPGRRNHRRGRLPVLDPEERVRRS